MRFRISVAKRARVSRSRSQSPESCASLVATICSMSVSPDRFEARPGIGAKHRAEPMHDLLLDRGRIVVVTGTVIGGAALFWPHFEATPGFGPDTRRERDRHQQNRRDDLTAVTCQARANSNSHSQGVPLHCRDDRSPSQGPRREPDVPDFLQQARSRTAGEQLPHRRDSDAGFSRTQDGTL